MNHNRDVAFVDFIEANDFPSLVQKIDEKIRKGYQPWGTAFLARGYWVQQIVKYREQ